MLEVTLAMLLRNSEMLGGCCSCFVLHSMPKGGIVALELEKEECMASHLCPVFICMSSAPGTVLLTLGDPKPLPLSLEEGCFS